MSKGPSRDRGSRKHILDLLERGEFEQRMTSVLKPSDVTLGNPTDPQPKSRSSKLEWAEWEAESYISKYPLDKASIEIPRGWWIPGRGTKPTWDMICQVTVGGKGGLLLAEAKAHERELDWKGKHLQPSAKTASKNNHAQIAGRIHETKLALNRICDGGFNLSTKTHYQLANRVAYLWKLAGLGIPVVLLYLGFTGDTYFADYLRTDAHWQRVMGGYLQGVVSQQFPERSFLAPGGGSLQLIIRSLPVIKITKR